MTQLTKLQFSTHIDAPVEHVWKTMLEQDTYRRWTSAFTEGSYYEGSWDEGATIRFLAPSGDGMVSEIAGNRPHEFISIKHVGEIARGVEDRDSAKVRAWAPAFENYTFKPDAKGTELIVEQDVTDDFAQYLRDVWPKALQNLKSLCETQAAR